MCRKLLWGLLRGRWRVRVSRWSRPSPPGAHGIRPQGRFSRKRVRRPCRPFTRGRAPSARGGRRCARRSTSERTAEAMRGCARGEPGILRRICSSEVPPRPPPRWPGDGNTKGPSPKLRAVFSVCRAERHRIPGAGLHALPRDAPLARPGGDLVPGGARQDRPSWAVSQGVAVPVPRLSIPGCRGCRDRTIRVSGV